MRIVVDLGCYDWGGHTPSLPVLAREYKPDLLYGFDPTYRLDVSVTVVEGVPAVLSRLAAWTHDGVVPYTDLGNTSNYVGEGADVPCFDFSAWLHERAWEGDRIVVKMDIEHAEVPVLEHMIETCADLLLDELLVEWHGDDEPLNRLRCPVRDWWM